MNVSPIICDDIREEISGKFSVIGVYSEAMISETFPVYVPTLCVFWRISGKHPLPKTITLSIKSDIAERAHEVVIKLEARDDVPDGHDYVINIPQKTAGLTVDVPSNIICRAVVDDKEVLDYSFPIMGLDTAEKSL